MSDSQRIARFMETTTSRAPLANFFRREIREQLQRTAETPRDESHWKEIYGYHHVVFSPSHAAAFGVCPRHGVIERAGIPGRLSTTPSVDMQAIYDTGHHTHIHWQDNVLGKAGILWGWWKKHPNHKISNARLGFYDPDLPPERFYGEIAVSHPDYHLHGHTDGVLCLDGEYVSLDIKTINRAGFDRLSSPKSSHVTQLQTYMNGDMEIFGRQAPPIERGVLLYICKDNSQRAQFWVDRDPEAVKPIYRQIEKVFAALEKKTLPPRLKSCESRSSYRARVCGACEICFSIDGHGKSAFSTIEAEK